MVPRCLPPPKHPVYKSHLFFSLTLHSLSHKITSSTLLHCSTTATEHQVKMSDLENSIATIIEVFHKYSEKEGDKHKLKKSELRDLINSELSSFLGHIKDQATVDSLMESLDADGDSECDFQEFMTFITMVTICCHEFCEHHEDE
ncbi:hypothetical protein SKAU_G00230350 [Synaphobranchus kaupii]|uniref:Protein S100-B n=1 Tax=Synaphobranchus kaupii TaxID=118154 RepID=A0A9Q1F5J3_SYNKA|nr:hypothetical protein SKAU_G00230350 [Synaphobranchus kaupii]